VSFGKPIVRGAALEVRGLCAGPSKPSTANTSNDGDAEDGFDYHRRVHAKRPATRGRVLALNEF